MVSPQQLGTTYCNKDLKIFDLYNKATFLSTFSDLESDNTAYFPAFEILNNLDERKKFRDDYVHITHKSTRNYLIPYFEKIYF